MLKPYLLRGGPFLALLLACITVFADSGATGTTATPEGSGDGSWPETGRIVFEVLRGENGVKLGEAQHVWKHDGVRYTMETVVETTGLAGMLYDFRYVQHSEGLVRADGLQPIRFGVEQRGKAPEAASFDWKAGRVTIERRGRTREYPIRTMDQDALSVWHLIGVRNGRHPSGELTLITGRTAAPATFEVIGHEAVRIPLGSIDALKVRVRARSGKLVTDMWLSQAHDLLPVRVLMTDHKGEVLDQRAISLDRDTAHGGPHKGKNAEK
jgi:hypothetical protein